MGQLAARRNNTADTIWMSILIVSVSLTVGCTATVVTACGSSDGGAVHAASNDKTTMVQMPQGRKAGELSPCLRNMGMRLRKSLGDKPQVIFGRREALNKAGQPMTLRNFNRAVRHCEKGDSATER